ncbi:MAG: hypothetical protein RBR22_03925 [Desulfuromonas sp.]|nr:hypothetical protein [Desulfuromonas sp.]
MKFVMQLLVFVGVSYAGTACAETAAGDGASGVMVWFFIGFIALFVVSQLIPSVILTVSLIKGLFAKDENSEHKIGN